MGSRKYGDNSYKYAISMVKYGNFLLLQYVIELLIVGKAYISKTRLNLLNGCRNGTWFQFQDKGSGPSKKLVDIHTYIHVWIRS